MSYDNTNRGSIWPNNEKLTDSHPDFTGSLDVDGKEFWVSAWKRKPDANPKAPSLSFSIKPKESRQDVSPASAGQTTAPTAEPGGGALSDEIPFRSLSSLA